jgi:hypothetical protein
MKRLLSLCIIPTAAALLWQSCVKDNGQYNYRDINEITVGNIPETVEVTQGDRLTVTPDLISSLGKNETHYVYDWTAYRFQPPAGGRVSYFLGDTRNLNDVLINFPVDDYMVNYRVTDNATGVFFEKRFRLSVKTLATRGYMIMSDVEGWMRLSMLSRFNNDYTFYPDVLSAIGCELPPQQGPIKLLRFYDLLFSPGGYALYLLTQSGTNRIHDETLKYYPEDENRPRDLYNVKNHFLPSDYAPENFIASNMYAQGGGSVVLHGLANSGVSSGKKSLYNRIPAGGISWSVPVNTLDNVNFFNASEKFVPVDGTNGWLVFDEDTRSFYQLRTSASICNQIRPDIGTFRWLNSGMDFIYGERLTATSRSYLILRNVSNPNYTVGGYYFVQVETSFSKSNPITINAKDIDKAELFVTGGPYGNAEIYYAVGGKLYRWNHQENLWWEEWDFGNDKITYLGFVAQTNNSQSIIKSDDLFIGTYNEASKEGTLGRYEIFQRGTPPEKMEEWGGFGKIVSVILK